MSKLDTYRVAIKSIHNGVCLLDVLANTKEDAIEKAITSCNKRKIVIPINAAKWANAILIKKGSF